MAHPYGTTGSLCPSFDPGRIVGLTVKQAFAIALRVRLPSVVSLPLKASVTFLEAPTPVKLATKQCPPHQRGYGTHTERAVFQGCIHTSWRTRFIYSRLSYTSRTGPQC